MASVLSKYYKQMRFILSLRWLPTVFENNLPLERELEKETYLISLKVFPVEIYQTYAYFKMKLIFLLSIFGVRPLLWQHLI